MHKIRILKLKEKLKQEKADAFFVSDLKDIFYLTGFTGSNGLLLITANDKAHDIFFTDPRYDEQSEKEVCPEVKCKIVKGNIYSEFGKKLSKLSKIKKIGVQASHLSYQIYKSLSDDAKSKDFVPLNNIMSLFRIKKDQEEIKKIRQAIKISEQALIETIPMIKKEKITEAEIACLLEYKMKMLGADDIAFHTIVAGGNRSAMPHARASRETFETGCPIVIDFGCVVDGYNSDLTRTFFLHRITDRFRQDYLKLKQTQELIFDLISPGIKIKDLDLKARKYLAKDGLDKYFTHSLGHGVGIDVHENPTVYSKNETLLEENMIFTIEPGIYFKDIGGMRIEDMVLVTKDGREVLSSLGKEVEDIIL